MEPAHEVAEGAEPTREASAAATPREGGRASASHREREAERVRRAKIGRESGCAAV